MNIRDPKQVAASLASWRRKENYRRERWHHYKAAKQTAHNRRLRSKWFAQLKQAKWYVDRRQKQLAALSPAKPKIVDLSIEPSGKWGGLGTITGVIGHYTAGRVDRDDDDAFELWRAYSRQHDAQWGDKIGYHLGVTRDGTIAILRPARLKGAHTAGANTGKVGVVMHGTTGDRPTAAQQAAVKWLAANAHTTGMPSKGRVSRDLRGVRWTGHNDWNATACPGQFKTVYTSKGSKR